MTNPEKTSAETTAPGSAVAWSPDQLAALDVLGTAFESGQRVLVLAGAAGVGKTLLTHEVTQRARARGWRVRYAAPTGKAVSRLREVLIAQGNDERELITETLHRLLYSKVVDDQTSEDLKFYGPKYQLERDDLLVVDEGSMVSVDLHRELMAQLPIGATVLYVGDREQLKPVKGDRWGPDFDRPTAVLTTVHRQAAGNPIIAAATYARLTGRLRAGPASADEPYSTARGASLGDASRWLVERVDSDSILVTQTHAARRQLNDAARELRGFDGVLHRGDRLRIGQNIHEKRLYNGDVVVVADGEFDDAGRVVRPESDPVVDIGVLTAAGRRRTISVDLDTIAGGQDAFKQAYPGFQRDVVFVDYGYAITVASSQGSSWKNVGFVLDGMARWLHGKDPDALRRLVYTGMTRASERLRIFLCP